MPGQIRKSMPRKRALVGATRGNDALGAARRVDALALRIQGKTYAEIGRVLGIAEKNAWQHVQNALAALAVEEHSASETLRRLEAQRLDAMLDRLWPKIEEGNPGAVIAGISIAKRRSDLFGIDAPTKTEVTGKDGAPLVVRWLDPVGTNVTSGGNPA